MNNVVLNIWLAVATLVLCTVLWTGLDVFNQKQLLKICIFLMGAGFISCILHLRACLRDLARIYKAMNKISGDLPQ